MQVKENQKMTIILLITQTEPETIIVKVCPFILRGIQKSYYFKYDELEHGT